MTLRAGRSRRSSSAKRRVLVNARLDEVVIQKIVGIQPGIGRIEVSLPQIEPIIEFASDEPLRPRVVEQSICLRPQHRRLERRAALGHTAQLIVGG